MFKKEFNIYMSVCFTVLCCHGCLEERPKIWVRKNKEVVVYHRPRNLEFKYGACTETDSLIQYLLANEMELKDSSEQFNLRPREAFLRRINKKDDRLEVGLSFVDYCGMQFFGDYGIKEDIIELGCLPQSDSTGATLVPICYCRYDFDFSVRKPPFINDDYKVHVNKTNVDSLLKIEEVMASIKASYR